MAIQLRLFHEQRTEAEEIADELDELCDKVDTLRKGLFKRLSTLASELRSAELRISLLEQQLYISQKCHNQLEARMLLLESMLNQMFEEKCDLQ
jgi:septal ring factor EnvC (AmiA/AmiB activator)